MNNSPVELARRRKIRERNPVGYRLAHWLIWIWVCYITPGPLTFDLFARGFDLRMAAWLGVVLAVTGVAGLRGRLPGVEPRPYIIRFTEDKPNPVYRRVCYTLAWSDVVTFALLNLSSLIVTIMTGGWYLRQLYEIAYYPLAVTIWILGAAGMLPRAKRSTGDEWRERRCFYGAVWAVCLTQPVLWLLWAVLPPTRAGAAAKLVAFVAVLAGAGWMAYHGMLPRTQVHSAWRACDGPEDRPAPSLQRRPDHASMVLVCSSSPAAGVSGRLDRA